MAWFEVKKINSNFLKETLNGLILKKSNEIAANINEKNNNLLAYAEELKGKKAGFFGSLSKIYMFGGNGNSPENVLDLHVEGRGSVEFYFVVQESIAYDGHNFTRVGWRVIRPTEYQAIPGPFSGWETQNLTFTTTIDGVEYGKVRMKDSYDFEQSFSITKGDTANHNVMNLVDIAIVTLY